MLTDTTSGEHMLASRRRYTDGAKILSRLGDNDPRSVFRDVLRESLCLITWGKDAYPIRLQLPTYQQTKVFTDPGRAFGQPIFGRTGTKVEDALERF